MMRTARFPKGSDDAHLLIGQALGVTWRREDQTDSYVRIPPALTIHDSDGAVWTAGESAPWGTEFMVLRNDVPMGEFATYIEYQNKNIVLLGWAGRRVFSRDRKFFL
jgi:hypothetical protein